MRLQLLFKANERQTKSAFWSPILIKIIILIIISSALICRKVLTVQTLQLVGRFSLKSENRLNSKQSSLSHKKALFFTGIILSDLDEVVVLQIFNFVYLLKFT